MELSLAQQIFAQVKSAKKILVALPEQADADAVAGGLGLFLFLRKLGKEVTVASSGELPAALDFLPGSNEIRRDLDSRKSLVVTLDTSSKPLDEISYQAEPAKVSIFLKPKAAMFTAQDITVAEDKFPLDLIFLLGCQSLESAGALFERHADLFFETPKINLDHQAGNSLYGSVNLVDVSLSSLGELLHGLLAQFESATVEADIATCLLAGIIAKTNSFQRAQTTPKAFLAASELIGLGGRQQEVIKHIYKTKPLPLLKLWGRALARLKTQDSRRTSYSFLTPSDFERSGAQLDQSPAVLKELLENIPSQNIVVLAVERLEGRPLAWMAFRPEINQDKFLAACGATKQSALEACPPYSLVSAVLPESSLTEWESRLISAIDQLPLV